MNIFRSNTKYLPYIQILVTIISISSLVYFYNPTWLILTGIMYILIAGFGISIGYHRYLTHNSFILKNEKLKWLLLWFGCLAGTGSPIGWVAVHRQHHKHSDNENDPHSPIQIGLKSLITSYKYVWNPWSVKELLNNHIHRNIHDYYFLLLFSWLFLAYTIDINLAIYGVILPTTIAIWVSTISNYLNHKFGYKSHSTDDNSRNLWFTAILTFGEGWHNNHHAEPKKYRFGKKWWEIDFGAVIIELFLKK